MRTVFNCLTKANHYTTGFQVFHTMMSLDTYATLSPNLQNDLFLDFPEILRSRNQGLIPTRNTFAVVTFVFSAVYNIKKSPTGCCTFHEIIGKDIALYNEWSEV